MCTDNGWLTKTCLYLGWQGSRKSVAEIPIVGMRTALSWRHWLGSPTAGLQIWTICGWYTGGWVSIQLSTYFEKQASFDDMIWKGWVNIVFGNFQMTWEFCYAIFIAKFEQGTFKWGKPLHWVNMAKVTVTGPYHSAMTDKIFIDDIWVTGDPNASTCG